MSTLKEVRARFARDLGLPFADSLEGKDMLIISQLDRLRERDSC